MQESELKVGGICTTDRCNLCCTMCHFNGPGTPRKTRTLAPELVVKFLRQIPPNQVVEFAGTGEFFMDANAVAHLRKAGELGHRPCVLTNGQLLTPELIDAVFHAGVRRIRISLDEIDADRYGSIRSGGDLQNVLDACAYLRSRKAAYPDLRVEIDCILFAESFHRQSEFVLFCRGRVDQVNFTGEYYEVFKFRNLFFQPSQRVGCQLAVYLLPCGQMSPCCAITVAQHYYHLDWLPNINVTSPVEGYHMFDALPESELRKTVMNTVPSTGDHFVLAAALACYKDTAFLANAVNLLREVTPSWRSSFGILVAGSVSDSFAVVEKLAHSSQLSLWESTARASFRTVD